MGFLIKGSIEYGEPGVFASFEENAAELARNVASLGFDVDASIAHKNRVIDPMRVARGELDETGEYDLNGLFIRLGYAIDSIGAKRVVPDTFETLASSPDQPGR
jgi:circadian clock protein KaiC